MRLTTLIAMAWVVYSISNLAHEALGHGLACVAVGGVPKALNSVYFDCDESQLSLPSRQVIAAAGTVVDLVLAALGALVLRRARGGLSRVFWWLLATVAGLQAAGYWLFSGLMNVGDWAVVADGSALGRVLLTAAGLLSYLGVIRFSLLTLNTMIGAGPDRISRAARLTVVPYLAGSGLLLLAGALNPVSVELVLISAAAAGLGGTSALAWMFNLLRGPRWPAEGQPIELFHDWSWVLTGSVVAAGFAWLGRTVAL